RVQAVCLLGGLAAVLGADVLLALPPGPAFEPGGVPPAGYLLAVLQLPVLVGMFIGAPLLAGDLAAGTHRLVLTQGVSHRRWALTTLGLAVAAVLAAAALAGLAGAVVLDNEHVFRISDPPGRWDLFDQQGPALVGSVVFGLCLGIAAGALTGSSFPAMVITFLGCQATRLT